MRVGATQLLNTILHLVNRQSRVTKSRHRRPLTAKFEQVQKVLFIQRFAKRKRYASRSSDRKDTILVSEH